MDETGTIHTSTGSTLFTHFFEWETPIIPQTGIRLNTFYTSPYFTTLHLNKKIQWRLKIDIDGNNFKVNIECFANDAVQASIMISALNYELCNKTFTFQKERFVNLGENASSQKISRGHSLKISGKITFYSKLIKENLHHDGLKDLEKLLESGNMSDVTLVVDEKKIHAHKAILSARSPVFVAMFQHDMMEKNENIVNIEGISYEVMKELCKYIYAYKVDGIEKIVVELLAVADKYCISDLYSLCETALIEGLTNLSVDNAIENLILATTYTIPNFKSEVMKFVIRNLKDVMETPQFNSLNLDILRNLLGVIARMKIEIPLRLDCST